MAPLLRVLVLASACASASGTLQLDHTSFDAEVKASGRSAFVKFLAPWWGHCKAMKPDWDALAEDYAGSKKVLIADVDCTGSGETLCETFDIEGFPTIKYFNPPHYEAEDFDGGRDLASLRKFALAELKPTCSPSSREHCSKAELKELVATEALPADARQKELVEIYDRLGDLAKQNEADLEALQGRYDAMMAKFEADKQALKPRLKLLEAVGTELPDGYVKYGEEGDDDDDDDDDAAVTDEL